MIGRSHGSEYVVAGQHVNNVSGSTMTRNVKFVFCFFVALVTLLSSVFGSFTPAYADEEEKAKETLQKSADDYGGSFDKVLEKYQNEGGTDKNTFGYIFDRLFNVHYLNNVSEGVSGKDQPAPPESGYACDVNDPAAGTVNYHNCDIPNITTEFFQDIIARFVQTGAQSANVDLAKVQNKWFGLPSNIPNDGIVPVNEQDRTVKYTALELYGYNLTYSAYRGEFDHIKVFTEARSLSNFGFMSSLNLGAQSVIDGVAGGLSGAADNVSDAVSRGDIIGAITGAYTGYVEGSMSGSINTIIDTSDLNVFNSNAWYRVGYNETAYGARELNESEMGAMFAQNIYDALTSGAGQEFEIPAQFKQLETPPEHPTENISKCEVTNKDGKKEVWGNTTDAPGVTEEECKSHATTVAGEGKPKYTWTKDGSKKGQTLAQWKKDNKEWFDSATKYKLKCTVDEKKEDQRAEVLADFYACIPSGYNEALKNVSDELSAEAVKNWTVDKINPKFFYDFFTGNTKANVIAPWSRYVCTNEDGTDKLDARGRVIPVYTATGELNQECSAIRAPIQNGFFGSGYAPEQEQPGADTRYTRLDNSLASAIFPVDLFANAWANLGLKSAVFFTQVSNTMLNLSFAPLVETFNIDDFVIDIVVSFRDSVFFPFSVLVIASATVLILAQTVTSRQYRKFFTKMLTVVAIFISGTVLMFRPDVAIKLVDKVPSVVETAIVGSIYGANNSSDQLCTATGTAKSTPGLDLDGKSLDISPADTTRTMLCENWRVFAFNPWVQGQWGTDYSNLYAAESKEPNKMTNTNGNLVGDASVNMGNDTIVNNWALYQLDTVTSGTSTTQDPTQYAGRVDPDFYRLVDLQAGPNNGAGTDSRYFDMWSAEDFTERVIVGMLSPISSGAGMVVVTAYSIGKIVLTFVSVLMMLAVPFVFLIGLFSDMGSRIVRKWGFTLLGIMAQRIALVTLLAIMMRIVISVGQSSTNYLVVTLATLAICLAFMMYRSKILSGVMNGTTQNAGGVFGGKLMTNPLSTAWDKAPKSVKNGARYAESNVKAAAGGALAGYITNGTSGIRQGAMQSMKNESTKMHNQQRRAGFGVVQSGTIAANAAVDDAHKRLGQDQYAQRAVNDVNERLNKGKSEQQQTPAGDSEDNAPVVVNNTADSGGDNAPENAPDTAGNTPDGTVVEPVVETAPVDEQGAEGDPSREEAPRRRVVVPVPGSKNTDDDTLDATATETAPEGAQRSNANTDDLLPHGTPADDDTAQSATEESSPETETVADDDDVVADKTDADTTAGESTVVAPTQNVKGTQRKISTRHRIQMRNARKAMDKAKEREEKMFSDDEAQSMLDDSSVESVTKHQEELRKRREKSEQRTKAVKESYDRVVDKVVKAEERKMRSENANKEFGDSLKQLKKQYAEKLPSADKMRERKKEILNEQDRIQKEHYNRNKGGGDDIGTEDR